MDIGKSRPEWLREWTIRIFTHPKELTFRLKHSKHSKRSKRNYRFVVEFKSKTLKGDPWPTRDEALTNLLDNLLGILDTGPEMLWADPEYRHYFQDGRIKSEMVLNQDIVDEVVQKLQGRSSTTTKRLRMAA